MAFPTGPRPRTESPIINIYDMFRVRPRKQSNERSLWTENSIHKIPRDIFCNNKTAYEPHVVSIGPHHHGKPHLKYMEEHKHRARDHLLERSKKPIDVYKKMLDDVVRELMNSYVQLGDEWSYREKFLQLMLLDGFFLFELLSSYCKINNYASNDPVFSFDGSVNILPDIVSDLLMVENQLPLLVLRMIIAVEWHTAEKEMHNKILNDLVVGFFIPEMIPVPDIGEGLHMLDIVRKRIIFGPPAKTSGHLSSSFMPSFSDLFDVGVKVRRSETESITDITFSNGILRLPVFIVEGGAKSFYLNVLAFERLQHGAGHEVSSSVAFMYGLIKSEKDAHLLRSLEFVRSTLGSDKAIADLTQELARDIYFDPYSPLGQVRDALNEYKIRKENENSLKKGSTRLRELRLAASFLLVLSVIQTLYAFLAYHTNNK
ncbi:UPF0481 protein At3g47200-like [Tasmannia lanceolata]|uniref:UPF0481 protein At3g47200-like n=1 Tax=Tasmannia lanceolata TaxID=3420 RepID=UPI004063CA1C